MKKKLIFVTEALWLGGIELSLINILTHINYDHFEVTVLALRDYRDLAHKIPENCRLIILDRYKGNNASNPYKYKRLFGLMEEPQNPSKLRRLIWKILCAMLKAPEAMLWAKYVKGILAGKKYDTAVIYDNRTAETAVRAINASKFLMFYHQGVMSHAYHDVFGWKKSDKVIAVSTPIAQRLRKFMPKYADKVTMIHNLVDVDSVIEKSAATADLCFDKHVFNIISCGRLSKEKGFHIAVEACQKLVNMGIQNFRWYFIGDGREKKRLEQLIETFHIEKYAILLGQKENPFPYVKQGDLFVQTSLFESYGLSMAEAMILGLPVVATRTDGAIELSENGKISILCDIDAEAVAREVAELLTNPNKLNKMRDAVKNVDFRKQNEKVMHRLIQLM